MSYLFERARTANQEAAIARGDAARATAATNKARSDALNVASRAQSARSGDQSTISSLRKQLAKCEAELAKEVARVVERDRILTEWKHAFESFKLVARMYGKRLGLTDDQRLDDLHNMIVNCGSENQKFKNTEYGQIAKDRIAEKENG